MGNCRSFDSISAATAKLILADGELQQFSWPIKVSYLLQRDSDSFICSSNEMEFDEFVATMGGDDVLQPGELYFELPLRWRRRRLQVEDMAELAAKASVALASNRRDIDDDRMIIRCCCCERRKIEPVILFCEKERPLLAADGGGGKGGGGGAMGRKFVEKLSAIGEE